MSIQYVSALWAWSFLWTMVSAQSLPYNPTTLLLFSDLAYIFSQNTANANQLLALNISSTLSANNLTVETISQDLPFQTNGSSAFTPCISPSGRISVYTGSCETASNAELWHFTETTEGQRDWEQQAVTTAPDLTAEVLPGANFLASSLSFSNYVHANASETTFYVFGGMCPESGASVSTWQQAAAYSNHMLRVNTAGDLDWTRSRGPPIAEAGFALTGLTPTYSNTSEVETQQQNFVILGGHTQTAFINMSQVAIWSLPEESWTFVGVDAPAGTGNTELAVKSVESTVDSRSGHTAVLTEDGTKIIVYGGWVGDLSQAAEPQLAILELGTGFGGAGDWQWSIPAEQPTGSGRYGHGAVMLPGNVMMVLGGFSITSPENAKRADSATDTMFFNATSLSWSSEYTNPSFVAATASNTAQLQQDSQSKANSKKLGLGLGLGLGLATLLIGLLIFCCYARRSRKRRHEEREKHIQSLAQTETSQFTPKQHGFLWSNSRWSRRADQPSDTSASDYEDLNVGVHRLDDNVPSPPRQLARQPSRTRNGRGMYQAAPNGAEHSNHGRSNSLGTAGPIHPIYEADEDATSSIIMANPEPVLDKRVSDPFRDTPDLSHARHRRDESESPARSREREIQEWVSDWAAADALLSSQAKAHSSAGRVSPTRRAQLIAQSNVSSMSGEEDSGRTASNLSERSGVSAMTISRSGSSSQGRSRTNSLRGFMSSVTSPFTGSTSLSPLEVRDNPPRSAGSSGENSFNTAHTSFGQLQAEAEGLLPRPDYEYTYTREKEEKFEQDEGSASPSKTRAGGLGKGRSGWLGSIRKAFAGDSVAGAGYRSPSATFGYRTPSPSRAVVARGDDMRRTVSAGAMLWRRKQGKSDWDDSIEGGERSNTFTSERSLAIGSGRRSQDSEDWDVESAARNRVVQVMFTVPKERLRVVNHDFDDEDRSESSSLRSKRECNFGDVLETGVAERVAKGKGKEVLVESSPRSRKGSTAGSEDTEKREKRGKVKEIVESIEGRASPGANSA